MKDLIIEKLQTVYDPEIPVNIWDLGLVYGIDFPKPTEVIIHMTLTRDCAAGARRGDGH